MGGNVFFSRNASVGRFGSVRCFAWEAREKGRHPCPSHPRGEGWHPFLSSSGAAFGFRSLSSETIRDTRDVRDAGTALALPLASVRSR